jgi:hypothetical protein
MTVVRQEASVNHDARFYFGQKYLRHESSATEIRAKANR